MKAGRTRREVVAGAAAAGLALEAGAAAGAQPKLPNILFILADDLGYADLSCYGRRDYETPVLDRLAADGLKLTQAYANSAVCSATRAALLTGNYQYRFDIGLQEPVANAAVAQMAMADSAPTMATVLGIEGYRTSLIGKWHLGAYPDHNPRRYGYDYCFGFVGGGSDYFTHSGRDKRPGAGLWENETPVDRPGYLTDILTERAIHEIGVAQASGAPFLMSLHYNAPHWPWEGPRDAARARTVTDARDYDGGDLKKYAEMVRYLDTSIGKVLAELKRRGLERDTIVIFTSDNGGERFSDVWPFVGMKGELLEGGVRVPAIVRWPARIRRGSTSDQVIASMDWMPTLARAAEVKPVAALRDLYDGDDLLGVLTGAEPVRMRKLYWRFKAGEQAALRDGDWKYLRIAGREHLFDVVVDPRERADQKERRPEIFDRLKADWAMWNDSMLPYPEGSYSENIKALGHTVDRY
jgi:arylsulfatase A-like enzyme